jgi:hypothetical protein
MKTSITAHMELQGHHLVSSTRRSAPLRQHEIVLGADSTTFYLTINILVHYVVENNLSSKLNL